MAQFEAKRKTVDDFNNAQKYVDGDGLQSATINNLVEGLLYAQDSGSGSGSTVILSNNYGDSEVNGYTQKAVNGVAQTKNYYNLGFYDSIGNVDGDATTIIRKTGYITKNDFTYNRSLGAYKIDLNTTIFKANINIPYRAAYDNENSHFYQSSTSTTIIITVEDIEKIFVQYELPSSYTEYCITHHPINTLNTDGEEWLRSEWEKGLNLFNKEAIEIGKYIIPQTVPNIGNDTNYFVSDYIPVKSNTKYTGYFVTTPNNGKYGIAYYNGEKVAFAGGLGNFNNIYTITTPSDCAYVRISGLISNIDKVFFYEGAVAYPYHPYNGSIIHEKDLSIVDTKISALKTEVDSDISDINNRLNSLGFKQGSFNLAFGTATQNTIKRQGNYCNIQLTIASTDYVAIDKGVAIATTSSDFYPLNDVTFLAYIKISSLERYNFAEFTLKTNGSLVLTKVSNIRSGNEYNTWDDNFLAFTSTSSIILNNVGYEAQPLG